MSIIDNTVGSANGQLANVVGVDLEEAGRDMFSGTMFVESILHREGSDLTSLPMR